MDELLNSLSKKLQITIFELRKIIKQLLEKESYEEDLLELFGLENISAIEQICENKLLFKETDENGKNNKHFVEFCLPEYETIDSDPKSLLSVNCTGENSKYFEYTNFNPIQSKVFNCAYKSDNNFLVCAPTGSGKTDVAFLSVLRALNKKDSKIAYIVPMKALANEITYKYKQKLKKYKVIEFTGDTEISNFELSQSDVIICTPEKFDAYTRKLNNIFTTFLSLVVIDEIHMLQDDRGSVLETIVGRIFKYIELRQKHIRIVGLSATLPNYEDVGKFLKTDKIYNFDQKYRPVSLKTSIVGIYQNTTKKQFDELFVERIDVFRRHKKQILVFVNSRQETISTAKLLINQDFVSEIDKKYKLNDKLEYLLSFRLGVHHAGLPRNIRLYMENKFKNGEIDILVCTSTLAWGVNLPAHVVIIKGTTYYDPNLGKFKDLGILDIYQIFGRAGRPQYKIKGEAILFTEYKKVGDYLKMIKNNQEIESRLLRHVANLMNSEIYLNNINNIADGLSWFRNTFMYVRLKKNPSFYGLGEKDLNDEDGVLSEYIYLTIKRLEECYLIKINKKETDSYTCWTFCSTEFGRITSFFYLEHETIFNWLQNIDFLGNENDVIELLIKNKDFSNIQIRNEEEFNLLEMASNMELNVEKSDDYKVYVLAQAYLRKYPVVNFALKCDLAYIGKNLERHLDAFLDFLLHLKRWNILYTTLHLVKKFKTKKKIFLSEPKYKIDIYECENFLKVILESENLEYFYIIIYNDEFPCFVSKSYKNFCDYIFCQVKNFTKIEIFDIQRNDFYEGNFPIKKEENINFFLETGYHFCKEKNQKIFLLDFEKNCKHLQTVNEHGCFYKDSTGKLIINSKYSIKIEFYVSNILSYKEFIRQFINISITYLQSSRPIIIICRSKKDYKLLNQEISTRLAILNFEKGKYKNKKIVHDVSKIIENCICIVTIEEALLCEKNVFIIFLTCRNTKNILYSVFDILRVSDRRDVLIFENENFVNYFNSNVLQLKQ